MPASYYWILVPVVSLMTLVPVSLNGMGVREWGTVLMLAPLGVGSGPATALAFLWFLTFSAVSLTRRRLLPLRTIPPVRGATR